MTPKTPEQIQKEIEALKSIKPRVRRTSGFGDNHHNAIDAQIEVLRRRMTEDQVFDEWGEDALGEDEFEQNVFDSAITATQWLTGELLEERLSDEWKELMQ